MPCPQNVNISVLMNARTIGNYSESADSEIIEAVESGKKCAKCGTCEGKCPFNLPIRETIAENIKFIESMLMEKSDEGERDQAVIVTKGGGQN